MLSERDEGKIRNEGSAPRMHPSSQLHTLGLWTLATSTKGSSAIIESFFQSVVASKVGGWVKASYGLKNFRNDTCACHVYVYV